MAKVLGFWIGSGVKQRLAWQINGEIISDVGLQRWVRENMDHVHHGNALWTPHVGTICCGSDEW